MRMSSAEAYKIFAGETRALEEESHYAPPSITRMFNVSGVKNGDMREFVGTSVQHHTKETFYKITDTFRGTMEELGHTIEGPDGRRTFHDANGRLMGFQAEGTGEYIPAPRHVHVHQPRGHGRGGHGGR